MCAKARRCLLTMSAHTQNGGIGRLHAQREDQFILKGSTRYVPAISGGRFGISPAFGAGKGAAGSPSLPRILRNPCGRVRGRQVSGTRFTCVGRMVRGATETRAISHAEHRLSSSSGRKARKQQSTTLSLASNNRLFLSTYYPLRLAETASTPGDASILKTPSPRTQLRLTNSPPLPGMWWARWLRPRA